LTHTFLAATALFAATLALASAANADPCAARLPTREGAEFSGVVRYVGDGDSICVGPADSGGETWIEVRLMDFDAPEMRQAGGREARDTLRRLVLDREAHCVVTRGRTGTRSFHRTHAICRVDGQTIGDAMRGAGVLTGGN
jgi:endonuclease YncB( thermonuclease family)